MKLLPVIICVGFLASCAPNINVSHFHLRGEQTKATPVKLVKAEANYRYDHNLEAQDRKKKHGHYYVIRWKGADKQTPLTVKLQYLQADQGRTPKVLQKSLTGKSSGKTEFTVTGENYTQYGRVLAWRAEIIQNNTVIAHDESFLWSSSR